MISVVKVYKIRSNIVQRIVTVEVFDPKGRRVEVCVYCNLTSRTTPVQRVNLATSLRVRRERRTGELPHGTGHNAITLTRDESVQLRLRLFSGKSEFADHSTKVNPSYT